jgi:hypothetical protein
MSKKKNLTIAGMSLIKPPKDNKLVSAFRVFIAKNVYLKPKS